jgi:serpin B
VNRWPALALSAALLPGCGTAGASTVHRGSALPVEPGELTAQDVAGAQTAFGLDLLHAVCARAPGENLLLSQPRPPRR